MGELILGFHGGVWKTLLHLGTLNICMRRGNWYEPYLDAAPVLEMVSDNTSLVNVRWDDAIKNPNNVGGYRVLVMPRGNHGYQRNDVLMSDTMGPETGNLTLKIEPGIVYGFKVILERTTGRNMPPRGCWDKSPTIYYIVEDGIEGFVVPKDYPAKVALMKRKNKRITDRVVFWYSMSACVIIGVFMIVWCWLALSALRHNCTNCFNGEDEKIAKKKLNQLNRSIIKLQFDKRKN